MNGYWAEADRRERKNEVYTPLAAVQPGGKAAAEAETDRAASRCIPGKREGEEDGVVLHRSV